MKGSSHLPRADAPEPHTLRYRVREFIKRSALIRMVA